MPPTTATMPISSRTRFLKPAIAVAAVLAAGAFVFFIGPKPESRAASSAVVTSDAVVHASAAETIEIYDPVHDRPFTASTWAPVGQGPNTLIVISHGFMGDHTSHDDLAVGLAEHGFTVIATTHPDLAGLQSGDQRLDPLVLRPRHLSLAIDEMVDQNGGDFDAVVAIGHSLGGYSALRLAGANPAEDNGLDEHCDANPTDAVLCTVQAARRFEAIVADPVDLADSRVTKIVLLAPAYGPLFSTDSLAVDVPVLVVSAEDDEELPGDQKADLLAMLPPTTESLSVAGGHFVFLHPCTVDEVAAVPALCADPAGVDRAAIHRSLVGTTLVPFIESTS